MISVSFSICCSLFIFLLSIIYFSKQKINNFDNKIYSTIILLNIIGIIIDVCGYFSFKALGINSNINYIISKIYLLYFISYVFLLMLYTYNLTFKNLPKIIKKIIIGFILICIVIFCLPIEITFNNEYAYTSGLSVNTAYFLGFIFISIMIFCLIKAGKNIRRKSYIPLVCFILFIIGCLIIQKNYPQITLLLTANSIVTFMMYFTIENPDVQVINELYKNKILVEKAFDDKSNFLFRMTQEIRKPISEMWENVRRVNQENNIDVIKHQLRELNYNCKQLDFVVNNVLNVTTLDYNNIRIINNKYSIYNLMEDIKKRITINTNKDIDYRFMIDEGIPYLYGDQIKLKQIIMSILLNSIKKTTLGFIELNINSIIKYDVCRLIITIEDSGSGMSLEKINNLLVTTGELKADDIKNLEKLDLNINLCQKIIKLLGGNLMIRSSIGKGTKVIITIDQRVFNNTDSIKDLSTEKFKFENEKKILISMDDEKIVNKIKRNINNSDVIISTSLYGQDLLGRIRTGNAYDLILINDNMEDMSGLSLMKQLKALKYKKPVLIVLNKNKEHIKHHYVEDGFTDYFLLDDFDEEINRIKSKYL